MTSYEPDKEAAVKGWFKDHVASREMISSLGGCFTVITWETPGTSNCAIRYVFDVRNKSCTITGDLGCAVVWPRGWNQLGPHAFAANFRTENLHYFAEKLAATSDLYDWDDERFRKELLNNVGPEYSDLVDTLSSKFETYCPGKYQRFEPDDEEVEALNDIDPDWREWLFDCGRGYSLRVYAWIVGLKMALEQLDGKEGEADADRP